MPEILITPHARTVYRARLCGWLDDDRAEVEIREALAEPLFHAPSSRGDLTLWGCRNRIGVLLVIATAPADEQAPYLLVQTCGPWWYWHEIKQFWRRYR